MSQRILISFKKNISKNDKENYDAIFTEYSNIKTLKKWIGLRDNSIFYFSPFKIRIRDIELWDRFYLYLKKLFRIIHKKIEDISLLYYNNSDIGFIEHPSPLKLKRFIAKAKDEGKKGGDKN